MSSDRPEDRWSRADRIFEATLDLEPRERPAYLHHACGDDEELRRLVERLLAGAEEPEAFFLEAGGGLQGPIFESVAADLEGEETSPVGTVVGRYRVVRELGRGGMAVVYLAQRADGAFEQRVALKLIKRGIDTDEVIQRFHQERQILANIRHPGIAQLLDGGVTADGQPYFALEYVEGRPIDLYCDEERLGVRERLRLFLRVAQAVKHAHQNLVVHRDIKPSNILVTADGHPKLLDFGIAKLVDDQGPAAVTRTFARALTPAYASPEQVSGAPVTTASDVYQLGLLLYLLLTGRWPYRRADGGAGEMARAICEEEPTRPSARVLQTGSAARLLGSEPRTPEEVGQARATSPARLRRQLGGDLDRVALMALRKEPERRYASVAQLIEDIERHLDGLPVRARGDSFLYRSGKLLRRHAAASVTAAAALVLLITVAVVYTFQLAHERDRARLAAARATQVSAFLRGLFAVSAPTRSKGEQITARQLLDRGARRIQRDLADQPEIEADLTTLMGDVYRELAHYEEAHALLSRAVALRRDHPGEQGLPLAAALHALAWVEEERGELEAARRLYEEAISIRQTALGPKHPEVARSLDGLGRVEAARGDFEAARRHHERALAILEASLGPDHPEVGRTLEQLGTVLRQVREFDAARVDLERALRLLQRGWEDDHPYVANARVVLADCLRFTGDPQAARQQYEKALAALEHAYGSEHPVVADVLNQLGNLLRSMGDLDGAARAHERALNLRRAVFGPDHAKVASSLNNLGLAHWQRGDRETARRRFEQSVATYESALGPDHPDVAVALGNLAELASESGDRKGALALFERVVAIREKAYGPRHSLLATPLFFMGRLTLELGDPAAAEPLLRRALALGRDREPHRHPEVIRPRIVLASCLTDLRRFPEAEELLRQNLAEEGIDEPSLRLTHEELTRLYEAWDGPTDAARERRAASGSKKSGGT